MFDADRLIWKLIYEMNSDRNDGFTKAAYRQMLIDLKNKIIIALEKYDDQE